MLLLLVLVLLALLFVPEVDQDDGSHGERTGGASDAKRDVPNPPLPDPVPREPRPRGAPPNPNLGAPPLVEGGGLLGGLASPHGLASGP